jgi:hypothetical protein
MNFSIYKNDLGIFDDKKWRLGLEVLARNSREKPPRSKKEKFATHLTPKEIEFINCE